MGTGVEMEAAEEGGGGSISDGGSFDLSVSVLSARRCDVRLTDRQLNER